VIDRVQAALILAEGISAALAIAAAYRWHQSAKIVLPTGFPIDVAESDGYSPALEALGRALSVQSDLSGQAARFAAGAAIFQAISVALQISNWGDYLAV
jgi:hypothetical protein